MNTTHKNKPKPSSACRQNSATKLLQQYVDRWTIHASGGEMIMHGEKKQKKFPNLETCTYTAFTILTRKP